MKSRQLESDGFGSVFLPINDELKSLSEYQYHAGIGDLSSQLDINPYGKYDSIAEPVNEEINAF